MMGYPPALCQIVLEGGWGALVSAKRGYRPVRAWSGAKESLGYTKYGIGSPKGCIALARGALDNHHVVIRGCDPLVQKGS